MRPVVVAAVEKEGGSSWKGMKVLGRPGLSAGEREREKVGCSAGPRPKERRGAQGLGPLGLGFAGRKNKREGRKKGFAFFFFKPKLQAHFQIEF